MLVASCDDEYMGRPILPSSDFKTSKFIMYFLVFMFIVLPRSNHSIVDVVTQNFHVDKNKAMLRGGDWQSSIGRCPVSLLGTKSSVRRIGLIEMRK